MLIGFTGPAGSGKDTCGAYLIEHHGYKRLSFAAPIYDALEAMGFGRPDTQEQKEAMIPWLGVSWRHLAQTLGTEWGRERVHPNLWLGLALKKVQANPHLKFVITDVRFENEALMVREAGGRVVHLEGRKHEGTLQHASEEGIQRLAQDVVVHNDVGHIHVLHRKLELALRAWL